MIIWPLVVLACVLLTALIDRRIIPVGRRWAIVLPYFATAVSAAWVIVAVIQNRWFALAFAVASLVGMGLFAYLMHHTVQQGGQDVRTAEAGDAAEGRDA